MSDDSASSTTLEYEKEIDLDATQVEAINTCCDTNKRLAVINGAAGTGKTTILKKTYQNLVDAGYLVSLSSPTGKAAKRIYEVTGIQAMTNHRLLEYTHPGETDQKTGKVLGASFPRRNEANPLEYDVLLVDEAGMNQEEIHRNLIDAMKVGACIRLFGDARQLEPIEDNAYKNKDKKQVSQFIRCLNDPRIPSVTLKKVYRQEGNSGILDNLHNILNYRLPQANDQWHHTFTDAPIKKLEEYIENHIEDIDFQAINNQILVPSNKSAIGTIKLNQIIQRYYFVPSDEYIELPRHNWDVGFGGIKGEDGGTLRIHIGDKVIFKSNNADLQIFNGESGIVKEFDNEFGSVVIDFGDREQEIPVMLVTTNKWGNVVEYDPRRDIDLAYAITIHKAQGSQYDNGIYIMNKCDAYLLTNRNMYTGCSRFKQHVQLITDQVSFSRTIHNRG